jgi:hypothetical protein
LQEREWSTEHNMTIADSSTPVDMINAWFVLGIMKEPREEVLE